MGGKCPHRKVKKRRLSHKTARRGKFLLKADDAVYDELVKLADQGKDAEAKELPVDDDLPGMGQFYCLHCDRYFASESVKDDHYRSKRHKKRVKVMSGPAPHTQLDAELAAGMGKPDNGLKLMSMLRNLLLVLVPCFCCCRTSEAALLSNSRVSRWFLLCTRLLNRGLIRRGVVLERCHGSMSVS